MQVSFKKILLSMLLFAAGSATFLSGDDTTNNYLSLYDFNSMNNNSQYEWQDFTDQVMGGKSEISTSLLQEDGEFFLRMEGEVSLKNNGGFIQTRLQLSRGFGTLDASDYDGIRLLVRGIESGYYLFFRTTSTILPWLYYSAGIDVKPGWQVIDIPWSAVTKGAYGSMGNFKTSKLKSIAVVAFGREFTAQIDLKRIGLYKKDPEL